VLDLDEAIKNHRPALGAIDLESVEARVAFAFRIPAIDLEALHILRAGGRREVLALGDAGICGQTKFSQGSPPPQPSPIKGEGEGETKTASPSPINREG